MTADPHGPPGMVTSGDGGRRAHYAVLIPARNEAEVLPTLFAALREAGSPWADTVVVVDNGSTDGTAEVARSLGARVVVEPRPGYGRACLAGIRTLTGPEAPDTLVFLDADDFRAPAQVARLLGPIERGEADLVIGERVSEAGGDGVRWHARLGNRLVLAVLRVALGSRIHDMGPFRAIRWTTLRALGLDDETYGWYVQMQVRALKLGARVTGVPVRFARRSVGTSKVSGNALASLRAGWVMLRTLAVELARPAGRGSRDQSRAEARS